ncbi:hypothetical protein IU433_13575 [Nocardia puris]|uniref:DNA primase/polymerase bifunctional N-terminal domain-containing protein n=1 Tax=Nocardia puris TaxID=208602 RepID=A0A366DMW6_9NOCA|nr:hypothetical protein [Nocardia puris]MBF6213468.1 hypothetical protein [Nocardia puris]MBF6365602.1 hypothetical protein [Nocardia puris]MBF6460068.1 hypothetical protein [Nocardia puris]RBO91447.1 hypothetical protein DFR74_104149 [Nocardia puris]
MFESCHTPHEAAHLLRHRYGLPVQLLAGRPVVTTGTILGAIVMPPDLGERVLAALDRTGHAPVIADPGERTWTFLVNPPSPVTPVDPHVRRTLAGHGVTVVPGGRHVLLPSTDSPQGWHWAGEPGSGVLRMPPRAAVIRAVHQVTGVRAHTA